jgi:hypothetical protein
MADAMSAVCPVALRPARNVHSVRLRQAKALVALLLRCFVMKKHNGVKSVFPTTLVGYFSLQISRVRVYNRRLIFIKSAAAEQSFAPDFMDSFSDDLP